MNPAIAAISMEVSQTNTQQQQQIQTPKSRTTYDPAIPFLDIYPKSSKSTHHRDSFTTMLAMFGTMNIS